MLVSQLLWPSIYYYLIIILLIKTKSISLSNIVAVNSGSTVDRVKTKRDILSSQDQVIALN